jgi:hypothetical protein
VVVSFAVAVVVRIDRAGAENRMMAAAPPPPGCAVDPAAPFGLVTITLPAEPAA